MKKLFYVFFLLFMPSLVVAQDLDTSSWERFVRPDVHAKTATDSAINPSGYFLVQLSDPKEKNLLYKNSALRIARKLDTRHYIIYFNQPAAYASARLGLDLLPVNDQWKLSPALASAIDHAATDKKYFYILRVRNLKQCKKNLKIEESCTIKEEYTKNSTLIIQCSKDFIIRQALPSNEVIYIGLLTHMPQEESLVLDMNHNVNKVNIIHHQFPSINGEGFTISVKEQKFDEADIDFKGRVIPSSNGESTSRHATEMATIIAGGGNTSSNSRGAAWAAQISSSSFDNILPDDNQYFTGPPDISVQNHSYGTTIENFYGAVAEAYDTHTQDLPHLLHIFSVGNNGNGTDTVGTYKGIEGFANMTGNFKMAKNILTVGAVDTLYQPDSFVSKGPAYDGRVKPDVSAYSTVGSSSSAALVSGLSSLLQQAYHEQNGTLPEAALIKAILMNTADDVGPPGIDFVTGYGNVNALRAIEAITLGHHESYSIAAGQAKTISIDIPSGAKTFKVLLSWDDPAAAANSSTALVNDLDLSLKHTTSNSSWLPWVLNHYPHIDSLTQLPRRSIDRINNVEQVTLKDPVAGTYEIHVEGFDIPVGLQKFHITYQWDLKDDFRWTFPSGSDNMPFNGKRTSIFRWQNSFDEDTGQLFYSTDNGINWALIDDNVTLSKEYYSWTPPEIHGPAIAKMVIGPDEFFTEPFTISRPLKTQVGFDCPDSLMLVWEHIANKSSYAVYVLGEKYLERLLETPDSSLILNKEQFPYTLYAIAPIFADGKAGFRNLTFNYTMQGVNCYVSSFFALENQDNENVELTLSLGTVHQIESISFEREQDGEYESIEVIENPDKILINVTDENPLQGINTYRAKIMFNTDTELTTEPSIVYFLTKLPIMLFPNPVNKNQELNIFTKNFSGNRAYLKLMNTNGQLVLNYEIQSTREALPVTHLKPGMYLYTLVSEGVYQSGKIIIR